jgi:phospholipase/lecithinase/hemolysin
MGKNDGAAGSAANNNCVWGDVQVNRKFVARTVVALGACLSAALLGASAAEAADFSAEYVFGDSLSDNGNLAELLNVAGLASGNFPDPPSFHDSFTNGNVAVVDLAQSLGLNLTPSLWVTDFKDPADLFGGPSFVPGTNYAVAGATAALGSDIVPGVNINLPTQVAAFGAFTSDHADPNALYVIMIGGNDVRDAVGESATAAADAIAAGVAAETKAISTLSGDDAKHFLIVNVPNVGLIPEFSGNPTEAEAATTLSQLYDTDLAVGLHALDPTLAAGTTLQEFDLYTLDASILADALSYGFTNTTDPCFTDTPFSAATTSGCGPDGANIDSFVYWDDIHPTARVQALWAQAFTAAVPEASTWAMLLLSFAGLGFEGYRRRVWARAATAPGPASSR